MEHRDIEKMGREIQKGMNWKHNIITLDTEIRNLRNQAHNQSLEKNVTYYLNEEADYMDNVLYFAVEKFIKSDTECVD